MMSCCKVCSNESSRQYRAANLEKRRAYSRKWAADNPERVRESGRKRNAAHPDRIKAWRDANVVHVAKYAREYRETHLKQIRATQRIYYASNADALRARARRDRDADIDGARERCRIWKTANPARNTEHTARRRTRKQGNGVFAISNKDMSRLHQGLCYLCGLESVEQVDHIIPISRGGRHSIGNLAGACTLCNQRKSAMFLTEYRYVLGDKPLAV